MVPRVDRVVLTHHARNRWEEYAGPVPPGLCQWIASLLRRHLVRQGLTLYKGRVRLRVPVAKFGLPGDLVATLAVPPSGGDWAVVTFLPHRHQRSGFKVWEAMGRECPMWRR